MRLPDFIVRLFSPILVLCLFPGLLVSGVLAPALADEMLPRHADPSARETPLDLSGVPAIRFLTTTDFPPFNYRDAKGELVGYDIDLARALCGVLGVVCTIQAWPWDQVEEAMATNQGDALIAGLAMTPQSGAKFDFTRIYLEFPARFAVPKAAAPGFSPKDLNGKKVAVREGSRHEAFLARYLPDVTAVPEPSEIAAMEAVRDGKADAYFGDGMRAAFWINANPDCCALAGPAYLRSDYFGSGLAIAVPAGRDAVRLALDSALNRLNKSGRLDELYLRWFPVGFY